MSAPIRTFWWRWKYPHRLNFGDEITAPLVERITGRRVEWAAPDACDLVGAGSVLQMLLDRRGSNRPCVWGSGFMRPGPAGEETSAVEGVIALRGTSSLARVDRPQGGRPALGDPGILAPLLLDGPVKKRYPLGIIPHYRDARSPTTDLVKKLDPGVRVIDVSWTPHEVAQEVASCDTVISSSLHGLIFSDALGVPNAHIRLGGKIGGGLYKFCDYYSAYPGADRYRAYSVPDGGPQSVREIVDAVISGYTDPVGLRDLQDGLIGALREVY